MKSSPKLGADHDLMQAMKSVTDMKAHLEKLQLERNTLWEAVKSIALLFWKPEDGDKRWVDIVKSIPSRFDGYVRGAAKLCVRNVLGTLRVLYPAVDLNQLFMEYDDENHSVTVERAED